MVTVNAKNFGLISGAQELQHGAIQRAIDHCFLQGGGEVVIPAGQYRTGDIRIRSNITLRLEPGVHLMGSSDPEDYFNYLSDKLEPLEAYRITDAPYVHLETIHGETAYEEGKPEYRFRRLPGSRWNNAILRGIDAQNIKIIGCRDSVIDGMNCFDLQGEEHYRGPHGITLYNCHGVELRGYTIQNTGNWAHWLLFGSNIQMAEVQVLAGHDGLDIFDCTNVSVTGCEFYTGDDCVAGFGNINVYLADSILNSSCSAMRFGATNALITRCHMYGPGRYCFRGSLTDAEKAASAPSQAAGHRTNMLSAFTYYADYSMPIPELPGNICITDCRFDNADRFLHYNFSGNETWQRYRPLDSIEFRDIIATGVAMPLTAYGREGEELSLTLRDIQVSLKDTMAAESFIHAAHFRRLQLENVTVTGKLGCLVKTWSDGDISLKNVTCCAGLEIQKAEEPFFSNAI